MEKNLTKGKIGENIAVEFLMKKGFKILARNWRYSRYGEIDVIAIDGQTLVFIEVKSRSSLNFGYPVEAINFSKIEKMKNLAEIYLNENSDLKFIELRFDAIGILLKKQPEITYYKDIYQF
ncbi:MAG: YraN family protein [bacterium]